MVRTAESVSPKHPDKLCDQVSDAILDALLAQDPTARVAVETAGGHGHLAIFGEVTSAATVDYAQIARQIVGSELDIAVHVTQQSPQIARGVDSGGAGDQGIMVGYATAETPSLMPLEYELARSLNQAIYTRFPYDGKTQITTDGGRITAIVATFQHSTQPQLQQLVTGWLKGKPTSNDLKIHLNPAGDWTIGGFEADAGLTGRKLAVDNYGPRVPLGGGCFSGKDPTKVDRSAAYMARRIAVDYLQKSSANEAICYLGYAIGVAEPIQATIELDGKHQSVTGYDLTPRGISDFLDLAKPQYLQSARYGHFGINSSWG